MNRQAATTQDREHHEATRATTRPLVSGTQGVVSAGHPLTAMAAMRMLLTGGNAFDAAVAGGFAAAVLEPTASYSLAAEGVALTYHARTGEVRALSGQGVAAGRATVAFYRERGLDRIPTGPGPQAHLSFTVPGVVDAYLLLLETYGTKTLGEVLTPAIHHAARGFPMYEYMHRLLQTPETRAQFDLYPPGGREVFFPGGATPRVGALLVQEALGATLARLRDAEATHAGHRAAGLAAARRCFYQGAVARTIVDFSRRVGGLLALDDLAQHRAAFEEPVRVTYAGREVLAQGPWTQGPVLLQALRLLEHVDLRRLGHNSVGYIHTVTEALKLAFADRERYYGDPRFVRVPMAGLLSPGYARERAALIRPDRAHPELPPAGDPWAHDDGTPGRAVAVDGRVPIQPSSTPRHPPVAPPPHRPGEGGAAERAGSVMQDGTTHLAVIDRDGNMVCLTPSGGVFRKSVFAPELGCTLSTRSEMFFVQEGHPNAVEPGKRPRTTLVNYLVCEGGVPIMTIGCPGGDDQTQADLQLLLNLLVFGMNPQQAVEAPRFSTQSLVNSFYPRVSLPGQLNVEPGIPEPTRAELRALGHAVVEAGASGIGAVVTHRDPESGVLSAGADPRRPTYALAW
jgi:gamma-glutamyltranspeptidase/glutathione hydrolase